MEKFYQTLQSYFPNALNKLNYLGAATHKLNQMGFTNENTLAAVSICRDEILEDFRKSVTISWGNVFTLGGLAGLPVAGKTGLTAFSHHIPDDVESPQFLFVVASHIAIGENGELCAIKRKNCSSDSHACGSLLNCLGKFKQANGNYQPEFRVNDIGQSYVESCLAPYQKEIINSENPELAITEKAFDVTLEILESLFSEMPEFTGGKFAVLGGIVINSPYGFGDYFSPKVAYKSDQNQKKDLELF